MLHVPASQPAPAELRTPLQCLPTRSFQTDFLQAPLILYLAFHSKVVSTQVTLIPISSNKKRPSSYDRKHE